RDGRPERPGTRTCRAAGGGRLRGGRPPGPDPRRGTARPRRTGRQRRGPAGRDRAGHQRAADAVPADPVRHRGRGDPALTHRKDRQARAAGAGRRDRRRADMVTLINEFTVTGDVAEFERVLAEFNAYMSALPGARGYRLLRSTRRPNIFVELADWDSS